MICLVSVLHVSLETMPSGGPALAHLCYLDRRLLSVA